MIGAIIGISGATIHLATTYVPPFTTIIEDYPVVYFFSYFFALIGGVLIIMGIADYFGRDQYKDRIKELEQRRSTLRERMFEPLVTV